MFLYFFYWIDLIIVIKVEELIYLKDFVKVGKGIDMFYIFYILILILLGLWLLLVILNVC